MKPLEVVLVAVIVSVIVFFLLQRYTARPAVVVDQEPEVVPVTQVVEQPVAPYWTVYGLPNYWPAAITPYSYYNVPFWGYGGPYDGVGMSSGYRGQRQMYMPHGWNGRGGYSGVSVGGGGGGGHGGGGGGHGGR